MNEYIKYKGLPKELGDRIRTFFHFKYAQSKYYNEDNILRELSEPLKQVNFTHVVY